MNTAIINVLMLLYMRGVVSSGIPQRCLRTSMDVDSSAQAQIKCIKKLTICVHSPKTKGKDLIAKLDTCTLELTE